MSSEKPKILLLTTEPNSWISANLTRAAEARGCEIRILDPDEMYIAICREPYVSYDGTKFMGADICIPRLSEHNLAAKLAIISHLKNMGMFVLNDADGLKLAQDKLSSQITLNAIGILTPRAAMLTDARQLGHAVAYLDKRFPMIIKTLTGTHGIGVVKVDSQDSLLGVVQLLLKHEIPFILQEFIPHEASRRIVMLGHQVLAANERRAAEGDFRTNAHQGAETHQFPLSGAEISMAAAVAKTFNLNFCAIDYIVHDDRIYVLEVNGSPGLENIQSNYEDRDLCDEIIAYCLTRVGKGSGDAFTAATTAGDDAVDASIAAELENDKADDSSAVSDFMNVNLYHDVIIHRINNDQPLTAKVDTGAGLCSISGHDLEIDEPARLLKFTLNDTRYIVPINRFVRVKNSHGTQRRPVIKLSMSVDGVRFDDIDFTVADRRDLRCAVLIGHKFLMDNGVKLSFDVPPDEVEEE